MPKGILSDDYGVTPDQCRWIVGGTNWPMAPVDYVPFMHPADVDVAAAPNGKALGDMLEEGQIDALISALVPQCVLEGSPRVTRLFADYESAEREYFRRTKIFPIMHTVVMRAELLTQHPGLAQAVHQGFCDAKNFATQEYEQHRAQHHADVMVPWFSALYDKNSRLLPDDWWPYGVEANRETIDTFLRYFFEQGLSQCRLTLERIFAPELLRT